MSLPISEKDVKYYKSSINEKFDKIVEYYRGVGFSNIFYNGEVVEKDEKNLNKIWEHLVSCAWDNANDLGMREYESGRCKIDEWEAIADSYFGASLEGIILDI